MDFSVISVFSVVNPVVPVDARDDLLTMDVRLPARDFLRFQQSQKANPKNLFDSVSRSRRCYLASRLRLRERACGAKFLLVLCEQKLFGARGFFLYRAAHT